MSSLKKKINKKDVVRIPLSGIVLGLSIVLVLGVVGGAIGQQMFGIRTTQSPSDNDNGMVTTVQEVKISPNKSVAEIVSASNRSVWHLGNEDASFTEGPTAFSITSDGLMVTAGVLSQEATHAYDLAGKSLAVEKAGYDVMYDLTYLKLKEGVVSPIDLRSEDISEGAALVVVGSNPSTHTSLVDIYRVKKYALPNSASPAGVQKYAVGNAVPEKALIGAPALDEEGNVAGIIVDYQSGEMLPISQVKASFERMADRAHEENQLQEMGVSLNYIIAPLKEGESVAFMAEVATVSPSSETFQAGIKRGDRIIEVSGEQLSWQKSVASQLSSARPVTIKIIREDEELSLILKSLPTPSAS